MDGTSAADTAGDIAATRTLAVAIREAVQRTLVGKSAAIDLAITALFARGHVLIEDVPGTGKTTLSKALAGALRCEFGRVQLTPHLVP
ncbi:MAG: MoxR family ATPase, partial [Rhodospirillaceae bacterium]|nr:MoxR family ATPase [Rhodospirillaceae bacterium]